MSEHREGTLFYDTETGRYDIRFDLESFYGGLHCGECFDVKVEDTKRMSDRKLVHSELVSLKYLRKVILKPTPI